MFWPSCDHYDRIGARVYSAVLKSAHGCPCCTFWRGVVLGAVAGLILCIIILGVVYGR